MGGVCLTLPSSLTKQAVLNCTVRSVLPDCPDLLNTMRNDYLIAQNVDTLQLTNIHVGKNRGGL